MTYEGMHGSKVATKSKKVLMTDLCNVDDRVLGWWPLLCVASILLTVDVVTVDRWHQYCPDHGPGPLLTTHCTALQLDPGKSSKIFQFYVVKIRNISHNLWQCRIGFLEFGHKSKKIILNKKPSNFEHIFCYWQFHSNKSSHSHRDILEFCCLGVNRF